MGDFVCVNCARASYHRDLDRFKKHIGRVHRDLILITCGQDGCEREFAHLTSLVRHIGSDHIDANPALIRVRQDVVDDAIQAGPSLVAVQVDDSSHMEGQYVEDEDDVAEIEVDIKKTAVDLILDLRATGTLTDVAIERFQDGCLKIMRDACLLLQQKTSDYLKRKNIFDDDAKEFLEEFNLPDPFHGLKTVEQQLDFFHSEYGLVKPEAKFLKYRIDNRLKGSAFLPTQVADTFQYVSIVDTLKSVVENDFLRNLILSEEMSTDGKLRSFKDGSLFNRHPFFQLHPHALRLNLYYDDLEVANPLGSKGIIHKLGAFYVTIQNLPPSLNSKLSMIKLLTLAYAEDLKDILYIEKALTPFFEDLKKLESEEGVQVELKNGEIFVLRATLVSLCADTLAAHELLGLLSPSAKFFCRSCLVSRPEFHANANAIGPPRTRENLIEHGERVKLNKEFQRQCGVKEISPLLHLHYFDPSRDAIFDIFHDMFLGVCQVDICCVLEEFICQQSLFSVEDFNSFLYAFDYGIPDRRNKPSANITSEMLQKTGKKLKQTGSQVWCLLRAFPFLVGHKVPEGNRHMELIIILQDIVQILFSHEISPTDIARCDRLISEHNRLFEELFVHHPVQQPNPNAQSGSDEDDEDDPDPIEEGNVIQGVQRRNARKLKGLKNKGHHMKHYRSMMENIGPLVLMWCARFEARHAIARRHAHLCQSFKNVPLTTAQVIQLSACSESRKIQSLAPDVETGPLTPQLVSENAYSEVLLASGFPRDEIISTCEKAIINSDEFKTGLFVSLPKNLNSRLPVFGCICDIVVKEPLPVMFIIRCWKNEGLSDKYNAYKVVEDEATILVHLESLSHHRPLAPWRSLGNDRDIYLSTRTIDM